MIFCKFKFLFVGTNKFFTLTTYGLKHIFINNSIVRLWCFSKYFLNLLNFVRFFGNICQLQLLITIALVIWHKIIDLYLLFFLFGIFPISSTTWKFAYYNSGSKWYIFVVINSLNLFYFVVFTVHLTF